MYKLHLLQLRQKQLNHNLEMQMVHLVANLNQTKLFKQENKRLKKKINNLNKLIKFLLL